MEPDFNDTDHDLWVIYPEVPAGQNRVSLVRVRPGRLVGTAASRPHVFEDKEAAESAYRDRTIIYRPDA